MLVVAGNKNYPSSQNFLIWKKSLPLIGIRPLFILPSLIAVVDQYPEIPSHNIGHFRLPKKDTFSLQIKLFVYSLLIAEGLNVSANIKFDMI